MLVAFNPAALRANIEDVRPGGMVIVNSDSFNKKSLQRAGYADDPLPALRERFQIVEIPVTTLNREALHGLSLSAREVDRCKNFFALGLLLLALSPGPSSRPSAGSRRSSRATCSRPTSAP